MRRFSLWIIVIGILAIGFGSWLGRTQLLAWYYVHQLTAANGENRDLWIGRVLNLEEAAVPSLLAALGRNDDQACENAALAVRGLVERWGLDDARAISLSRRICDAFPALSVAGQERVLALHGAWI